MSSLDFDSDIGVSDLEKEWREASEVPAASTQLSGNLLDMARQRLDRTEARRA